ncbi:MAG: two-component system, OmpR family, response regulator [Solirubrobacteraceae bacterium]|nr:two-component system, OmpR family, response regulator [Solirubrobacteraceae bacterium]
MEAFRECNPHRPVFGTLRNPPVTLAAHYCGPVAEIAGPPVSTLRLLLVEDDLKLVRALGLGLRREGYAVDVAHTGEDALSQAAAADYDALILDVLLPGVDGFEVCEELRRRRRWMPVLMLTALADVDDRIRGLDAGADDYLVKPFDFGELLARLRALTRRGPSDGSAGLEVGDLRLDPATRVVTRDGRETELTAREFELLAFLVRRPGQVVSRRQLLEHVWDGEHDASSNIVDVYVGYLRKKLEDDDEHRLIRTVRGVGFVLEA